MKLMGTSVAAGVGLLIAFAATDRARLVDSLPWAQLGVLAVAAAWCALSLYGGVPNILDELAYRLKMAAKRARQRQETMAARQQERWVRELEG